MDQRQEEREVVAIGDRSSGDDAAKSLVGLIIESRELRLDDVWIDAVDIDAVIVSPGRHVARPGLEGLLLLEIEYRQPAILRTRRRKALQIILRHEMMISRAARRALVHEAA